MKKVFIDTNILIYANDRRIPEKQLIARKLISDSLRSGNAVLSTQVLQEYVNVALNKLKQNGEIIIRQLKILETLEVIRQSPGMIRRAVEIKSTYKINFWDACIISNAESAECDILYSEDLNPGQFYSGIKVVNPFTSEQTV